MGARKAKQNEKEEEAKKQQKKEEKKPERKIKSIEGVRGVVRLAEMNIEGTRKVRNAVLGIKGIGKSLANSIVMISGIDPELMLGTLTDEQVSKLEDAMKNPSKYGVPSHMLNRRSDPNTGEDRHLISSDLSFNVKGDIDFMKKIRCYKGIRHELGQPVRGQRTKSSFRTGMQVGVTKAKLKPGAAPAPSGGAPAAGAPSGAPAAGAKPGPAPAGAKPAVGAPAAKAAPAAAAPAKKEEKKK